jgi:hypothetical protein
MPVEARAERGGDIEALRTALLGYDVDEIHPSRYDGSVPNAWIVGFRTEPQDQVLAEGFHILPVKRSDLISARLFNAMNGKMNRIEDRVGRIEDQVAAISRTVERPLGNAAEIGKNAVAAIWLNSPTGKRFLGTGLAVHIEGVAGTEGTVFRWHMANGLVGQRITIDYQGRTMVLQPNWSCSTAVSEDLCFVPGFPDKVEPFAIQPDTVVEPGKQVLLCFLRLTSDGETQYSFVTGSVNGESAACVLLNAAVWHGCCAGAVVMCTGGEVKLVGILGHRTPASLFVGGVSVVSGEEHWRETGALLYRTLFTEIAEPIACISSRVVYRFLQRCAREALSSPGSGLLQRHGVTQGTAPVAAGFSGPSCVVEGYGCLGGEAPRCSCQDLWKDAQYELCCPVPAPRQALSFGDCCAFEA